MQKFLKHYRFCPRCGGTLKLRPKQKADRCISCGFEVYDAVTAGITLIIVNAHGEVLLTKRANEPHKAKWGTPGGFIDRGENAEDAARREAREELDVRLPALVYFGTFPVTYEYQSVRYAHLEITFIAHVQELKPKARDDISVAKFFPPTKIPYARLAWPSQRKALRAFFKR